MASTYAAAPDRGVAIGRAFNNGVATIGSNPLATLGVAFLFGALPSVAMSYLSQQLRPSIMRQLGLGGVVGLALLAAVIGIVFATITNGALVRATVAHAEGRRAGIGESLTAGLRVLLPLIGLGLLIAFCVGIGMILLLVPGIILYTMWCLASPAMIAEQIGVGQAISRSAYLTKGARWKVFGVLLLIVVFSWIASGLVSAAAMAAYGGVVGYATAMRDGFPFWYLAMTLIVQTILSAVWGTIMAALYVELRNWKDGPSSASLADVFA